MQMQLTFDPSSELDEVKDIIAKLEGEAAPAPAAKKTAARRPAKKAAAAPAEEPEEETEEEDGPTLEDAVARAQELVGEKRTDEVKAALKTLKVERVTKLTGPKIAKFLELVADGEDDDVV